VTLHMIRSSLTSSVGRIGFNFTSAARLGKRPEVDEYSKNAGIRTSVCGGPAATLRVRLNHGSQCFAMKERYSAQCLSKKRSPARPRRPVGPDPRYFRAWQISTRREMESFGNGSESTARENQFNIEVVHSTAGPGLGSLERNPGPRRRSLCQTPRRRVPCPTGKPRPHLRPRPGAGNAPPPPHHVCPHCGGSEPGTRSLGRGWGMNEWWKIGRGGGGGRLGPHGRR
jgi:hypothetical protein